MVFCVLVSISRYVQAEHFAGIMGCVEPSLDCETKNSVSDHEVFENCQAFSQIFCVFVQCSLSVGVVVLRTRKSWTACLGTL